MNEELDPETELQLARRLCELQARVLRDRGQIFFGEKGDRMVRLRELLQRTAISKRTIGRLEAAGRFPKRHKLGPRAVGWPESQIAQWIANPMDWHPV